MAAATAAADTARRVAVVTGANKGIGYHIAEQLLHSGKFGRIILACRDEGRGRAAAASLLDSLGAGFRAEVEFVPLDLGATESIDQFAAHMEGSVGSCDCLINNGAIAFKDSDPTPFAGQTGPTLAVNYWGTTRLTDRLLPLLRRTGSDPSVVMVASMAGHLSQLSPARQAQFAADSLDRRRLDSLVQEFASDVAAAAHHERGWGSSNYGFSKLALIAYTKMAAREEAAAGSGVSLNCCCPGYCRTDMSSNRGPRSPADGARNATLLALQTGPAALTGEFVQNGAVSAW